jgi:hypothetical protein
MRGIGKIQSEDERESTLRVRAFRTLSGSFLVLTPRKEAQAYGMFWGFECGMTSNRAV